MLYIRHQHSWLIRPRLTAFSFNFAPLLVTPPPFLLPDPIEDPSWYGELWLQYPLGAQRIPSHFGQMLRARSQFRVIMNEACQARFSDSSDIDWKKATVLLAELHSWFAQLPESLQARYIVLPSHLQLQ